MPNAHIFTGITSEGGILPADFLAALTEPKSDIEGLDPVTYRLAPGERVGDQVNRSWNRLKGCWVNFQRSISSKQPGEPTTTETRERWLYPLFHELDFGRLAVARPIEHDGKSYPVSHGWGPVPIHLVGTHVDLDKRTPGAVGAAKASPHSLVQQVLNASDGHLWGVISNGFTLRLLRDNVALTRMAYVEWDLQAIFDGDLYPEFFLLWLVCHQSRFEAPPDGRTDQCWIEKWKKQAEEKGLRALENLRPGVEKAIASIGAGLVSQKANQALRSKLSSGQLTTQDFYRQILRIIYRILFLFVAEDRRLLHPPLPGDDAGKDTIGAALKARQRYRDFYSIGRLREVTLHRAGTPHPDLWQVFQLVSLFLGSDSGCPELAIPPLGSFLWSPKASPDLNDCLVSNRHFLEAVLALGFIRDENVRRAIDYKNLGSEELGSVYESLLELHPIVNADAGTFELKTAPGHERKTTGSYYTDDSLVQSLLDTALEPVIAETVRGKEGAAAAEALLKLKICDLAVGSGHFLIGAAHRLARRVASARTGEEEPSPEAIRSALREVIGRCLYGVDINPMAAELCRVSLWLEALEPGKPLSFLDHHIRVGNSLLGATPELIAQGIPDDAFKPIEGDDKNACSVLKKRNKADRSGIGGLFVSEDKTNQEALRKMSFALESIGDDTPDAVRRKAAVFEEGQHSYDYLNAKGLADAWCAAFILRKTVRPGTKEPIGITQRYLNDLGKGNSLPAELATEVDRLASEYHFFHWHLAFPEVFARGGFDCVLGNPPWEAEELVEKEFFAAVAPHIASVRTKAKRSALIAGLETVAPQLFRAWKDAVRQFDGRINFMRNSGAFPLGNSGKLNTYRLFAELAARLVASRGRSAQILKSGIVSAQDGQKLFGSWTREGRVVEVREFINTRPIFPAVVANERFCWLVLTGKGEKSKSATYAFALESVEEAADSSRSFSALPEELALMNPADNSVPPLSSQRDYRLVLRIHRSAQPLRLEDSNFNPWRIHYAQGHLNSASDSGLFADNTLEQLEGSGAVLDHKEWFHREEQSFMPLYEGKYIAQLNHRFSSFAGVPVQRRFGVKAEAINSATSQLEDPRFEIRPRYWLAAADATQCFSAKETHYEWLFGFRDVCRAIVDARTVQACVMPRSPCLDGVPLLVFEGQRQEAARTALLFNALWASFAFDYVARQKIHGAHLTKAIAYQLPVSFSTTFDQEDIGQSYRDFVSKRSLELTVVSYSLLSFARDLGYGGPPFRWDEERRFLLRCELDAAFFHLYLPAGANGDWRPAEGETAGDLARLKASFPTPRDAVAYIMDTFPIVKRKDEEKHGEYRTKRVILEIYDEMAEAMRTRNPYKTRLAPPPGPPADEHGTFLPLPEWKPGRPKPQDWPAHIHPPKGCETTLKDYR